MKNILINNRWKVVFLIIIFIFAIGLTLFGNRIIKNSKIFAKTEKAKLFFIPNKAPLKTLEKPFALWITTESNLAFARIELSYDPTVITLTQDPKISNPQLYKTIEITPINIANTTGKVIFVIGLDSTKKSAVQSGTFQLATLYLKAKSSKKSTATQVKISSVDSQVVNLNAISYSIYVTPLIITVKNQRQVD